MKAVAAALCAIGRICFRWADRIGPDAVTRAFDDLYRLEQESAAAVRWPPHDPHSVAREMHADGLITPTQRDRMLGRESYIPPRHLERAK